MKFEGLRKLRNTFKLMNLKIPSAFNLSYINFSIHAVHLSVNINICKETARQFIMSPHKISNPESIDFCVSIWQFWWNSKTLDFYSGGAWYESRSGHRLSLFIFRVIPQSFQTFARTAPW